MRSAIRLLADTPGTEAIPADAVLLVEIHVLEERNFES
jgi:hypothetical protein